MDSSNFSVLFVFIFPFAVFLSFSPFFFFGSDQKYYSEFEKSVLVSQVLVPAIGGFTWDTFVEWGRGRNLHSQELRPHPQRGEQRAISPELSIRCDSWVHRLTILRYQEQTAPQRYYWSRRYQMRDRQTDRCNQHRSIGRVDRLTRESLKGKRG